MNNKNFDANSNDHSPRKRRKHPRGTPRRRELVPIKSRFNTLFEQLKDAIHSTPENLLESLKTLPPTRDLPPARTFWLLCAILRYRQRQRWGEAIVRERLPAAYSPTPEIVAQDPPVMLSVPGMPDWCLELEPYFGYGRLLGDRPPQDIHVDLSEDGSHDYIYCESFNRSLPCVYRWTPEWRLRELYRNQFGILTHIDRDAVAELADAGLVECSFSKFDSSTDEVFKVTSLALEYEELIAGFCQVWEAGVSRLWHAALINDWQQACELADDADEAVCKLTYSRARMCDLGNKAG